MRDHLNMKMDHDSSALYQAACDNPVWADELNTRLQRAAGPAGARDRGTITIVLHAHLGQMKFVVVGRLETSKISALMKNFM